MIASRKINVPRAVWLVARLYLRRQLNAWQSARLGRRAKDNPALRLSDKAARSGTATKSRGRSFFSAFILLMMAFNGFFVSTNGLARLSELSRNAVPALNGIPVSPATMTAIRNTESALGRAVEIADPMDRDEYVGKWNRYLDDYLLAEVRREGLSEDGEDQRLEEMRAAFQDKGAAGFTYRQRERMWVSSGTWPADAEPSSVFFRVLGLISLLWIGLIVFGSLGLNNVNLGQVEWSFEWFYTFPVPARALFSSKIFVYGYLNPLVWIFLFPFLILVYAAAGYSWFSIPVALLAILYLTTLAGALCTLLEVAVRKFLTLAQLKNVQALFTILGTGCFLFVYAACLSQSLGDFLVARARALPGFLAWNPFTIPLALGLPSGTSSRTLTVALMIGVCFAFCAASLVGSEWLTRDGLLKAGGPYQGTRKIATGRIRRRWLRGIPAREMLLLMRDRNLLVQVVLVPILIPAFYMLVYSGMVTAASQNFRHAAVLAFGIGAYSLLSSAMQVLSRENNTLWLILTYPQSLASILAKKVSVWAALGVVYGASALLLITRFGKHLHPGSLGEGFLALYGIVLYAFIAGGIGILATNVLETEVRARIRSEMIYLYMILAAMYANAIYTPSVWTKLAQLVLSTLLVFALWQKVNDNAPYLLDPVAQPPRSIGLADGMIAALAFFVAQGLIFLFLQAVSDDSLAAQTTLAYIFAGLIVAGLALYIFWRQDIPDLWRKIGFLRVAGEAGLPPIGVGLLRGAALGGVAALTAILYVRGLDLFPSGHIWKQHAELSSFLSRADQPIWLCILAIVAAPLFEEFLFRGLIFQGLKRFTGPALAVLGSAALFALVHPPISVIPVFGLGIAAAISFQKSGSLAAPILTHAVYNAAVIFLSKP
jgi:ABC-2 type transport system permease protein